MFRIPYFVCCSVCNLIIFQENTSLCVLSCCNTWHFLGHISVLRSSGGQSYLWHDISDVLSRLLRNLRIIRSQFCYSIPIVVDLCFTVYSCLLIDIPFRIFIFSLWSYLQNWRTSMRMTSIYQYTSSVVRAKRIGWNVEYSDFYHRAAVVKLHYTWSIEENTSQRSIIRSIHYFTTHLYPRTDVTLVRYSSF